jgi:leucyl aminopeptidase
VPAPETAKAMRLDVLESPLSSARVDCVVAGLHEGDELPASTALLDRAARGRMKALAARGDLPTRLGETLLLVDVEGVRAPRVVVVGLGPRKGFDRRAWRKAVGAAFAALLRTRATSAALAIDLPDGVAPDAYYFGRAIAELLGAALYRTNDRKSGRKPRAPVLARLLAGPVASDGVAAARRGLAHGQAVAGGMNLLRDLGNLPGNVCTPRYLATQARELAREQRDLKVKVLEEADLKRLKMGCLLAVSRGSAEPPRLVVVEYRGGRAGAAPVVLVGKGVTFDTGGISLKDPGAMDEMKYDMCGAASVLAAISVAAR